MTKNALYQVDAFTTELFGGNPAAVVPLSQWLPGETMQSIAAENNLSETAFFVKKGAGYDLRWFTPAVEVDFCGHATLATAHILFTEMVFEKETVNFQTRVGQLSVKNLGDGKYLMDFPADELQPLEIPLALETAVGIPAVEAYKGREDILYLVNSMQDVLKVQPDFKALGLASERGVLVTAPGVDCDFVSRGFFPNAGVDEDPVTGSAHTTLTPFWAKRLGKSQLTARQISTRGGYLECEFIPEQGKVLLTGSAVTYLTGTIFLP